MEENSILCVVEMQNACYLNDNLFLCKNYMIMIILKNRLNNYIVDSWRRVFCQSIWGTEMFWHIEKIKKINLKCNPRKVICS